MLYIKMTTWSKAFWVVDQIWAVEWSRGVFSSFIETTNEFHFRLISEDAE